MPNTLYIDPFSGISGDMFLGLLIDLGVSLETLNDELSKLALPGWSLLAHDEKRQGLRGCRALLEIAEEHHHRTWSDIDLLIARSPLTLSVQERSRAIFRRVGEAEAKVHGIPLAEVHFHEVGALDSILDIVGAAIGLELLGIDSILCGPLPLNSGCISSAHGTLPLPAPATLEVLKGCPLTPGNSDRELVTPTGAAIIATCARFAPLPAMTIERIGYGVGSRDLADRPNLLRGILGTTAQAGEPVSVLESHLDDANPEWLGHLLEKLLAGGALDAAYTPLQMKKNRPGVRLTVVTRPVDADRLGTMILRESSALGVRRNDMTRQTLQRQSANVMTPLGEAKIKLIYDDAKLLRITPEYESCLTLAATNGCPLPEIYRLVEQAANDAFFPLDSHKG